MAAEIEPARNAALPTIRTGDVLRERGAGVSRSAAGGTSFRKMGVIEPYRTSNPAEGRSAVTGKDADRFAFKVPTLRNVELTYPYFHDGAADTLAEAVQVMGRIQLGRQYGPDETAKIVAFLKTLTGEQPQFALPMLPPSADATPQIGRAHV